MAMFGCSRADAGVQRGTACTRSGPGCADDAQCLQGQCPDAGMLIRETKALTDALCVCEDAQCKDAPLDGLQRVDADYAGIALSPGAQSTLQALLNRAGHCLKAPPESGESTAPDPPR